MPDLIPNNITTTAVLTLDMPVQSEIDSSGDYDWYQVSLQPGVTYHFTLSGAGAQPLIDPYLQFYNGSGVRISWDDDSGPNHDASLYYYVDPSSGYRTYYISAEAFGSETGGYSLNVRAETQDPLKTIDWGAALPTHTVYLYFAHGGETYAGESALRDWSATEKAAALSAAATYSAVADIQFVEVSDRSAASMVLVLDGGLSNNEFGAMTTPEMGSPATGLFNPNVTNWTGAGAMNPGGSGYQTLLHEFGHGLGLAHPHDNGGTSEVMPFFMSSPGSAYAGDQLNQGVYTVMSYNDGWLIRNGSNLPAGFGYESTPMALDVAVIQQKYGAVAHNGGDTVYDLGSVAGYQTIWDTGGVDAISYSGSGIAHIDLRAATLEEGPNSLLRNMSDSGSINEISAAGGLISFIDNFIPSDARGFTIAHGVQIENAYGGTGRDLLTGNELNNVLRGNDGDDVIYGGLGDDILEGGAGQDDMYGGMGADVLYAGGYVFNNLYGGEGNDHLYGGGENTGSLYGGAGDDLLEFTGGWGWVHGDDGRDTLRVHGVSSDYSLDTPSSEANPALRLLSNTQVGGVLYDVEYVQFDDRLVHAAPGVGRVVDFNADPSTYAGRLRDFDGNDLGGAGSWVLAGHADIQGDGDQEYILFNSQIGRWATVGPAANGRVYFDDHGWGGDTRVVGIYIDPQVQADPTLLGGPFDSQRRFQNDLNIGNIKGILGAGDYNHDGLQEIYFSLTDGTAYLHAYMHADGNIQYANYQSQQQVTDYLTANGFGASTWSGWF